MGGRPKLRNLTRIVARGMGRSNSFETYYGEGNGNPLHYSFLENFIDRGACQATVHEVTESDTTKQLTHTHTHTHTGSEG